MPSNSTAPEIYRVSLSDRATEAMVPSPFSASISEGAEINEAVWAFYQDAKKKEARRDFAVAYIIGKRLALKSP